MDKMSSQYLKGWNFENYLCMVLLEDFQSRGADIDNHSHPGCWYKLQTGRKFWAVFDIRSHLDTRLPWVRTLVDIGKFDLYHIGRYWYNQNPIDNLNEDIR